MFLVNIRFTVNAILHNSTASFKLIAKYCCFHMLIPCFTIVFFPKTGSAFVSYFLLIYNRAASIHRASWQTARKVVCKLARKCVWGCSVLFNSVVEPQLVRRVFFLWLLRFCFFDSNGQEFTVRAPESVAAAIGSELENRDARAARLEHSK